MTLTEATQAQKQLANKRRQAYWQRRRVVQAMSKRGSRLMVERMPDSVLTGHLCFELSSLLDELEAGSSPRLLASAQAVDACVRELLTRGTQTQLEI